MNRQDRNRNLVKGALCVLGILGIGMVALLAKAIGHSVVIVLTYLMMIFAMGVQFFWGSS